MRITAKPVKIANKPSLTDTLKALELNVPNLFTDRQFKVNVARQAVSDLRKKGYDFKITEEGLVNEYIVTRLK